MIDIGFEATNFSWKDYFKNLIGIKPDRFKLAAKLGIIEEYNAYQIQKAKETFIDIEAPAIENTIAAVSPEKVTLSSSFKNICSTLAKYLIKTPKYNEKPVKTQIDIELGSSRKNDPISHYILSN